MFSQELHFLAVIYLT